jgi:hypothetical protein
MARRQRQVRVSFFAIQPVPGMDGHPTFDLRRYPREETFDHVRCLDPADESYRIKEDMFGGEFLCLLHDNGSEAILGAYYRDNLGKLLTEYKGEISEVMLREGEAPVDASYMAFFPNDIVGLLRTSQKSPRNARIAQWLSFVAGCPCALVPLRDPDTLAQLAEHPLALRRLIVGANKSVLPELETHGASVAQVLRDMSRLHPGSAMVSYEVAAERSTQEEFSRLLLQDLHDLVDVIPILDEIKVKLAGRPAMVDLKRQLVLAQLQVILVNTSRIGLRQAPEILFDAYEQERVSVERAAQAHWDLSRDGASSFG